MMEHINFSEQWKKLDQDFFTTIRSFNIEKFAWYKAKQGEVFEIRKIKKWGYRGKTLKHAKLLLALAINTDELSDAFLDYDTDKNFNGWKDKIRKKPMHILLFFGPEKWQMTSSPR